MISGYFMTQSWYVYLVMLRAEANIIIVSNERNTVNAKNTF